MNRNQYLKIHVLKNKNNKKNEDKDIIKQNDIDTHKNNTVSEYDEYDEISTEEMNLIEIDKKLTPISPVGVSKSEQLAISPVIEPVVEPVIEPVVEPVIEPVVEPVIEPVVEPVVEPIVEPVIEPVIEPVLEPVLEQFFLGI